MNEMARSAEKLKILVVEDSEGDFILFEESLREEFLEPVIDRAVTFSAAAKLLKSKSDYDTILLDLTLPDSRGTELVTDILDLAGQIPVIVLTGYLDKNFGIQTLSLGVSDYLLKDEIEPIQLYKSISYSRERKRIVNQLAYSEEKYRNLFQLSPQPMWLCDLVTFRFLNVNEAAIKHYGYSLDEFLSMTVRDIYPKEDIPILEERIKTTSASGSLYFRGIVRHKKKNGEIIDVDLQSNTIDFDNKKNQLVLANDITEKLNYISSIQSQNEKLKEIAWIQSHVVRAPIARMIGLIDLIKNFGDGEVNKSELIEHLLNSAHELDGIIRDITNKTESIELGNKE